MTDRSMKHISALHDLCFELVFDGRNVDAIMVYRIAANVSLKDAKGAVDAMIEAFTPDDWAALRAHQAAKKGDAA